MIIREAINKENFKDTMFKKGGWDTEVIFTFLKNMKMCTEKLMLLLIKENHICFNYQSQKQLLNCKCLSVCHKNTSASQNYVHQPNLTLSTIMPLNHHATQPL